MTKNQIVRSYMCQKKLLTLNCPTFRQCKTVNHCLLPPNLQSIDMNKFDYHLHGFAVVFILLNMLHSENLTLHKFLIYRNFSLGLENSHPWI